MLINLNCILIVIISSCLQVQASGPKLIVISFDGFRPDYISPERTPNLYNLAKLGVWGKMKCTYSSKTFPNHYSIATGLYQETHGIVNNVMFDPLYNESFNVYNPDPKWWDNGGTNYPIWLANEDAAGRSSGVIMWPGSHIKGMKIRNKTAKYVQGWDAKLEWNDRVDLMINWMTDPNSPANLVFAYFHQPDDTSHYYGTFSAEAQEQIKRDDNAIGYLLEVLKKKGLIESTNLIVLSDHGMVDVNKEREIDLAKLTDLSTYKMYGSSPTWNIRPNPGMENHVYNALKQLAIDHHFKVYKRLEIPEEYHYKNHRRVLDILIEANEGYDIFDERWDKPAESWGNHGYNNSLESMRPMFIANGPNFKKNYIHETEFMNIDLYPLMIKLLQIKDVPSNGTYEAVKDMLIL